MSSTIRDKLSAILQETLTDSGRSSPSITDDLVPLQDMAGFDSLAAVDAEVRLTQTFGIQVEGIFRDTTSARRVRSVGQIVEALSKMTQKS